ncbi:MAG: TauD/TfdA family dioxygenase [Hyphomicrobiales bacterium]|nr:TauD/TfdA family dioxygenase [Hyphomicrobiales bacterium]
MPVPGHQSIPLPHIATYKHIEVRPAGLALGAHVSGVDLSEPKAPEVYSEIADALWRHHVLFFRDQALTPEAHMALAGHFGETEVHEILRPDPEHPEISILLNDETRPPEINVWHTDVTFREKPSLCSILYCEIAPEAGGDTMWLNQQLAYETLAEPIKEMLLGLQAEHDILHTYSGTHLLEEAGGQEKAVELSKTHPPVLHPVVIAHPMTGKPCLLVNETHTKRIVGMSRLESRHLMAMLIEHQRLHEFQLRFSWQPGSIAMWDNFATQHYALADYYPQMRRMRRITVAGRKPLPYRPEHLKQVA